MANGARYAFGDKRSGSNAETISDSEFKKLKDKKAKTKTERHQERKASLNERYGVDVTPELVWEDDDNWYPQLRLHYFLTLGREHLTVREAYHEGGSFLF